MKDEIWDRIRIRIRDQGLDRVKFERLFEDLDPELDYIHKLEIVTRDVALYADVRLMQVLGKNDEMDIHMVNVLGNAMSMYASCLPERTDRKVTETVMKAIRAYRKMFKKEGIF